MILIIFAGLIAMATADVDTALIESNNQFTSKMFDEVVKSEPGKSVIMSGFSVLPPLAQLALASVGESHDELLRAIGLPNDNVTKEVFTSFNTKLRDVKGVELKMANRIYIAQDAELNPTFAALSRDVFNSDVKNVNFPDASNAAKEINTWVEEQTNNKIKDLVDPKLLDPSTRAVLVNAIYFKGLWKNPFHKPLTSEGDFHVTSAKTVKVPFMRKTATYKYVESSELDAKLLELPYEGEESSLLIVLPNNMEGLNYLQEKIKDRTALSKAVDSMKTREVDVTFPKFKIETTTDLKKILQKMEVSKLFNPDMARLENLLVKESNVYISTAIQKAFLEINEEGTEAAAANEFILFEKSGKSYDLLPIIVKADHPFYYELKLKHQKLFSGLFIS